MSGSNAINEYRFILLFKILIQKVLLIPISWYCKYNSSI